MNAATTRPALAGLLCLLVAGCTVSEQPALQEPDTASRMRVASVAEANGQPGVALSIYAIEAGNRPDDPQAQARYAAALIRAGGIAQADEVLSQALASMPDAPALLIQSGRIRLLSGSPQALGLFERALVAAPNHAEALSGKGMALDLAGRHAEALPWHAAATKAAPSDLAIGNNYALSLMLVGRPDEAIPILALLAQRPEAPARVMNNLALAYAAAGHLSAAQAVPRSSIGTAEIQNYAQLIQSDSAAVEQPSNHLLRPSQ
ncbi:tetratricopeptide repeat protein [Geminicoccus harenae]|uniref:tetratricopeptide repeat protein n=1 Tax=Geminicoccus harenae TaxID=2498453 RepID=UPI00168B8F31|nr:tetratricopeptide repeat protein [Geminicoccus harenae]